MLMSTQSPFTWHHFEAEIILFCVCWYHGIIQRLEGSLSLMIQWQHKSLFTGLERANPSSRKRKEIAGSDHRTLERGGTLQTQINQLLRKRSYERLGGYYQMGKKESRTNDSLPSMSRAIRRADYTQKRQCCQA